MRSASMARPSPSPAPGTDSAAPSPAPSPGLARVSSRPTSRRTSFGETAESGGIETKALDLTDRAAAARWIGEIERGTGRAIDVLVSNAGGVAGQGRFRSAR